ncbi:DUF2092 domain-containing protein [Rariglobus hedericola]
MRYLQGLSLVLIVSLNVCAQEAQPLVDAAAKLYAECQTYSIELDNRIVQLKSAPGADGQAAQLEVISTEYRRLNLKVQRPYGYWLMAQLWRDGSASRPNAANGAVAFSVVSRSDDALPRQGVVEGGTFKILLAPAEQFNAMANTRLGPQAMEDPVLRYFHAHRTEPEKNMSLGLTEADVIGRETINGKTCFRIIGKTGNGHSVMLWIDRESSLVARSVIWYPGTDSESGLKMLTVIEAFYNQQKINPGFAPADFSIGKSTGSGRVSAQQMGFGETADLLKLTEISAR